MQIFVKMLRGNTITLQVESSHSIEHVKARIEDKVGVEAKEQRLVWEGKQLNQDGWNVADDSIHNDSSVELLLRLRGGLSIKVKTLTGEVIEIILDTNDTIASIKQKLEEIEGIPPRQQRIIFSGKPMDDDKTVADYRIQTGYVLHLVLALRGGF